MVVLPLSVQERIRTSYLKSEYEKSGIPVFEVSYKEWKKKFYLLADEDDYSDPTDFMGIYYNGPFHPFKVSLPPRFIVINSSMSNSWKLAVFYHELGHHACVKARCSCASHGFIFKKTELHAELAAIYIATQRRFRLMTFNMLVETILDLDHAKQNIVWNATRMVKHPVFINAINFVGDIFNEWLDDKSHAVQKIKYFNAIVDDSTRMCRWHPSSFLRQFAGNSKSILKEY